jgi:ParB family chromosome partitioning protein
MLMESKLDMGHARALVGLDAAQQIMLANRIVQQDLSVREVEVLVKKLGAGTQSMQKNKANNQDVLALQNLLSEKLGTGVTIAAKANGTGTLKINYSNLDELDEIIKKVSS